MTVITEPEFAARIRDRLNCYHEKPKAVTGPGRSGAIAAVYASHMLGVPFLPFGSRCPSGLAPLLIVDTVRMSGRTLRKAARKYDTERTIVMYAYDEPPRLIFWYEGRQL